MGLIGKGLVLGGLAFGQSLIFVEVLFIKDELMLNEEIRDKEVRLIDSDGSMLGIVALKDAQQRAAEKNMDLVKISPKAVPPVCKIMDYGKYRFEMSKKEKEARKKQKITSIKEIRVSPGIEEHDFDFKMRNAQRFLRDGDKVKVTVRFRGREVTHVSIGQAVLERFAQMLEEHGSIERKPLLEGRNMTMIITPKQ